MKSKTESILTVLHVLAWIAMIGYCVKLGSQVISFAVSFFNPVASKQFPGVGQDLLNLYQYDFRMYAYAMTFAIAVTAMYVILWRQVIGLLSKLNLKSPFTFEVSKILEGIAYWLIAIWVVGFIGEFYVDWLAKRVVTQLIIVAVDDEFLFIAGIVYIISQVFKRGIEIQEENQQTI